MIRAAAFVAVAGYRNDLIAGEDPELSVRLRKAGWRIWRLSNEMTLHDAAMTRFSQWWKRSVRCGWAYAQGRRNDLIVQAVLSHEVIGDAVATEYRPDLAAVGMGKGIAATPSNSIARSIPFTSRLSASRSMAAMRSCRAPTNLASTNSLPRFIVATPRSVGRAPLWEGYGRTAPMPPRCSRPRSKSAK